MAWHVGEGSETHGPFEEGEILQAIAEGLIGPGVMLKDDVGRGWHPIEESIFANALPRQQQPMTVTVTRRRPKADSTRSLLMQGAAGIVIAVAALLFFARCQESSHEGIEHVEGRSLVDTATTMQRIHGEVARDALEQYRIVQNSGTPMDRCVQAGVVAAALLQAKAEKEYARWHKVKAADCKAAGLPEQETVPMSD